MPNALIIVDMQADFLPGGALGVEGGDKVVAPVVAAAHRDYDLVVTTGDSHPPDTAHFGKWPVHCVAGADGEMLHPDIAGLGNWHVVKGTSKHDDGYSAFEGLSVPGARPHTVEEAMRSGVPLGVLLKMRKITDVDVVGLALDYCVKATALDAQREGFNTTVLRSATAPVTAAGGVIAEDELTEAGVTVL